MLNWYEVKVLLPDRNIYLRTTLQATTSTHAIAIAQRRYASRDVEVVQAASKVELVRDDGKARKRARLLRRKVSEQRAQRGLGKDSGGPDAA